MVRVGKRDFLYACALTQQSYTRTRTNTNLNRACRQQIAARGELGPYLFSRGGGSPRSWAARNETLHASTSGFAMSNLFWRHSKICKLMKSRSTTLVPPHSFMASDKAVTFVVSFSFWFLYQYLRQVQGQIRCRYSASESVLHKMVLRCNGPIRCRSSASESVPHCIGPVGRQ